jgi:hypothetical protein
VYAEESGKESGREFAGELEERGGAGLAGAQAEVAESFAELVGADRPVGLSAGEEPRGVPLVAESGVSPAGGNEVEDERGERIGQDDGLAAQPDPDYVTAGLHVGEGEAAGHWA